MLPFSFRGGGRGNARQDQDRLGLGQQVGNIPLGQRWFDKAHIIEHLDPGRNRTCCFESRPAAASAVWEIQRVPVEVGASEST